MVINQYPAKQIKTKILKNYISNGGLLKDEDINEHFILNRHANFTLPTDISYVCDNYGIGALKIKKINIADVINFNVDITDFKISSGQIKKDSHDYATVLDGYNSDFIALNYSVYRQTGNSINDKFTVFCVLVGLTDLNLSDVYLIESDQKLTITIKDDHKYYYGSLDITTW